MDVSSKQPELKWMLAQSSRELKWMLAQCSRELKTLSSLELSIWPPQCCCLAIAIQGRTTNMSRAGVSRQENRSTELLKRPPGFRLHNYEPRIQIDKHLVTHRLAWHFKRWPHIKPELEARRDEPTLAAHQGIVDFDTKPITTSEIEKAKRLSLIWTEESPFTKFQEQLTKEQLRAAAPEVLGFNSTEEKYYMLFRSLEDNCSRCEGISAPCCMGAREQSCICNCINL